MSQFLRFHEVHGNDIKVCCSSSVAYRTETTSNGLIFSIKPIKVNEKVSIKLIKVSDKLPSIVSIGFTVHDPSKLRENLPASTRSDLKRKGGFWVCPLPKQFCVKRKVLFFYVSNAGTVHYGFDKQEKGVFEKNVDTKRQLWALVDIWSPKTTIQIVDLDLSNQSLMLHLTCKRNVKLTQNSVRKKNLKLNYSYAFTSRHLKLNEKVLIKMLTDGHLSIGLTSCDPDDLTDIRLPENIESLLDRPEYWVVINDPTWNFKQNDELSYIINTKGELKIWRNSLLLKIIHVDSTSKLWGFFSLETVEAIEISTIVLSRETMRPLPSIPDDSASNDTREASDTRLAPPEAPPLPPRKKIFHENRKETKESIDCIICCEKSTEVALYPCGHMCMCFQCAERQWRRGGDGLCPICRQQIKDILKIYK